MVTRTKRPVTSAPAAAKVGSAAARPPRPAKASLPADVPKANLLRAGLKALGNVRDDVVQHQSRVFEAILGIDPGQALSGLIKRDSAAGRVAQETLGLRKFEAVFDQRVAGALERLGVPTAKDMDAMRLEIEALRAEVAALELDAKRASKDKPKASGRKR